MVSFLDQSLALSSGLILIGVDEFIGDLSFVQSEYR